MNTPPMYTLELDASAWAEVYASMRLHRWADELMDIEWTDPDTGERCCRGTASDWKQVLAATSGDRFIDASDTLNQVLHTWLKRFLVPA